MSAILQPIDPQLFDRPAPRYTSYPTALQFHDGVGEADYVRLLQSIPEHRAVSLYIHVPFCHSLCHYCGCFTRVVSKVSILEEYVASVLQEIERVAKIIGRRIPVAHLHFGGGSPNFLPSDLLCQLVAACRKHFFLMPSCEIATELDSRLMSEEKIQILAEVGFNRVSFGVQDFHDDVQAAVNRVQHTDHLVRCVAWLRKYGIRHVNFDLMYGLPLQTEASVRENMRLAASMQPDRIALFGYAHVPWMRPHQKLLEKHPIPGSGQRLAMYEASRREAARQGYKMIGIDHFCRKDDALYTTYRRRRLHRNFQGYTTDQQDIMLGFGLSSISSFPEAYVQNTTDPTLYRKALAEGRLPVVRGVMRSDDDRLRARIIEQLMCYLHVDLHYIHPHWRQEIAGIDGIMKKMDGWAEQGVVSRKGSVIRIASKARSLARLVCADFDDYFEAAANRHSRAV